MYIYIYLYIIYIYSKNIELRIGRIVALNIMVSPFSPHRPLKYHGAACWTFCRLWATSTSQSPSHHGRLQPFPNLIHWGHLRPTKPGSVVFNYGVTSSNDANVMGIYKVFRVHSCVYIYIISYQLYWIMDWWPPTNIWKNSPGFDVLTMNWWTSSNITMDNLYEYETIIIYELFWRVAILDFFTLTSPPVYSVYRKILYLYWCSQHEALLNLMPP